MQEVGRSFRASGVAAIYLAHGTFVGPDALGILSDLARAFPAAGNAVRRVIKRVLDTLTGDVGNYTDNFARLFASSINTPGAVTIPVRLFEWSSENHHVGRADGAVRLIDELAALNVEPGSRVLLWGHSHAGNVFALLTNLLAGNGDVADRFFQAAEIYYRWPIFGWIDIPVWNRVRELLSQRRGLPRDLELDLVTFGTPIRYGWDSGGYARLLHFINHRPVEGLPDYRAPFPPKIENVMTAAEGDYVQQLGIAGTNIMPSVLSWRAWLADRRLNGLLQPGPPEGGPLERFRPGAIVPDEGTTLLVDYGPPDGSIAQHQAGHAVYTRKKWLLFHAEQVAGRFYSADVSKAA